MNKKMTVELVDITPEIAENYLKYNNKNRKPSDNHIKFLINEMTNDRFLENGEAIIFDKENILSDGQHRLIAIAASGKTYTIPVVRGVEVIAMATYDTGKNRSAADVLSINGFKHSVQLSNLTTGIDLYVNRRSKTKGSSRGNRRDIMSNTQVLQFVQLNYDWMKEVVKKSQNIGNKQKPRVLSFSQLSLLSYLLGGESPTEDHYNYIKCVCGVTREANTASSYLFNKLYNSKINKEPLNFYWVIGMFIKGWNYYSDGNPSVRFYKFENNKPIPKINKITTI
jgi:hypothetical protein